MTKPLTPDHKIAGTLAPLFALRGQDDLGVGDISALRELIDWAALHHLGFVQMLPINKTGNDHSPYNLISSMAFEPTTIACNPEALPDISAKEYQEVVSKISRPILGHVAYQVVKERKFHLLELACKRFFATKKATARQKKFAHFIETEQGWLDSYSFHQALTDWNDGKEVITEWPEEHRSLSSAQDWLMSLPFRNRELFLKRQRFHRYLQWIAYEQWQEVRIYAEKKGISLVGDVPVGVSIYSADVWAEPTLFDLTRSCGAPPEKVFQGDPFTMQWGQNWGFPLYNWQAMSKDNFHWWRRRLQSLRKIFHILRVDHALGFYRIYSFPWRPEHNHEFLDLSKEATAAKTGGKLPGFIPNEDDTEAHRESNRIHGETLLQVLAEETGGHRLITEDLGEVPPYVRPSLARLNLPGFKIPQWEIAPNGHFTHGEEYPRLAITTYATHDHPPLCVIWNELFVQMSSPDPRIAWGAKEELKNYLHFAGASDLTLAPYNFQVLHQLLHGLWKSNAWLAAVNINDLLGTDDRFNVPGTACGENWTARLSAPIAQWDTVYASAIATWNDDLLALRP